LLDVLEHAIGDVSIAKEIFQRIFRILTSKRYGGNDAQNIDHIMLLTDQIMSECAIKTFKDTGKMYYYDNDKGAYIRGAEWLIEEQCEILYPQIQTYKVQEVVNHIKRRTGVERLKFDSDLNILNLQNGLLNIQTGEFKEHSSDLSIINTVAHSI
jgi:phage/plasmid-associated DNA primase